MSEIKSHIDVEQGSERSFGVVFAVVFLIIAVFPMFHGEALRLWALAVAAIFLCLAFLAPATLALPNKLWFKFGMFLGAIVAPLVMMLVYFVAVVPVGLLMRALGKDLLNQRLDKDAASYWIKREQPIGSMRDQF